MATAAANPLLRFEDNNGNPLSGGTLEFYESGSSAPKAAYGDANESTSFTTKTLDSRGEAVVYFGSGNYKIVVKDASGSTIKTLDPVSGAATSGSNDQWVPSGDTPTYVSPTSFTVPGDKTAQYHRNRAFKATVTAGTVYGHYTGSSYTDPNTTVTVKNDSGQLDSGLSAVWHGIETANNSAVPRIYEGSMRVIGCNCKSNPSSPGSRLDIDADAIVLRNSKNQTVTIWNPGAAITNDITISGPVANGRDQSGAFSTSSWIHFYWIWNGTTLATISSVNAPPTGPTLPSGYTHWAYVGSNWIFSNGLMRSIHIRGSKVYFHVFENAVTDATATTETSVSLAPLIPPNALSVFLNIRAHINTGAGGLAETIPEVRYVTGKQYYLGFRVRCGFANDLAGGGAFIEIPNDSQTIYFRFNDQVNPQNISGRTLSIDVLGYTVPNGGE